MRHVFCLGPLITQDGERSYCCLAAGDTEPDLATGPTKAAALKELVQRGLTAGAVCEEGLRKETRKLGLEVAPLPRELVQLKAAMAVGMDHEGDLGGAEHTPQIVELLQAAAQFDGELPWELFDSEIPLTLHVEGAHPRTLEACVLGSGGEEFGLAIYFAPGSVAKVERLFDAGGESAAASVDSLALLLNEEPEYIVDAVEEATGAPFAPIVIRVRGGEMVPLPSGELALLTASLRAVVALCKNRSEGRGESTAGPRTAVRATATSPGPRAAEAVAAAAWGTVGRNEPCPCGSGQKFKRCHGGANARAAASSAAPGRSRWHAVDEALTEKLSAWGAKRFTRETVKGPMHELYGEHPAHPELFLPWSLFECPVEGKPVAKHYLEERGASLSADERVWLEAQLAARSSAHEVLEVRPGEGMDLVDLLTGTRATVHEVSASRVLVPRDVVVGRVTSVPGEQVVAGMHPELLPPAEADAVLEQLGGTPSAGELVQAWCAAVEDYEREQEEPSVLKNTDGDPLQLLEDRFRVRKGEREKLVDLLAGLEHVVVEEDRAKSTSLTFIRPGNPVHPSWENTIMGNAKVTPATLTLSTNSEKRADALRARVEAAAGALLTFTGRKRLEAPELPGGGDILLDAQLQEGSVEAVEEAMGRDFYRTWPDQPHPLLGGARPRERLADAEGRRAVHRLLRTLENTAARDEMAGSVEDVRLLRRELGLDALGQPLPNHDVDLALGAGRKLSESLLDLARPLLDRGASKASEARRVLKLAAIVWNAAVADAETPSANEAVRLRGHLVREGFDPADFDLLLERKRQRHPHDLRRVQRWELHAKRGKDYSVLTLGSVSPELGERARAAGFTPQLPEGFQV
ncbi:MULTISPECIES: SEC-C domain-containing protein [Myxococcaceae]|uniref:SEC-C domain-containing protein n=1 Tax=Myxococcaceae TaxID=31 RepID=UPI001E40928E|nr:MULTISPECIES: SEC-C domain-containing protein [Myxococcaceae]